MKVSDSGFKGPSMIDLDSSVVSELPMIHGYFSVRNLVWSWINSLVLGGIRRPTSVFPRYEPG